MPKFLRFFILTVVLLAGALLSWKKITDSDDISLRLAKSETFHEMNFVMDKMEKEALFVFRNSKSARSYTASDFQRIQSDSKLSDEEKNKKLEDMGVVQTQTYKKSAVDIIRLNKKLNEEFPELTRLSREQRKAVFKTAFMLKLTNRVY